MSNRITVRFKESFYTSILDDAARLQLPVAQHIRNILQAYKTKEAQPDATD